MFIKQVPDSDDVKWTENNNIDRTNMESILNPLDKQAIEAALNLKESNNAKVTAVSMGPSKAKAVLKEALAMGVDEAYLLCDSKFAGSDTNATSKVLAAAITEKFPDTDLILFGQSAIDGETAQTSVSTAARLNYPYISNVNGLIEVNEDNCITAYSETETEKITTKTELPAVIAINNYCVKPRTPKISGYIKAKDYIVKSYNLYDLNLSENTTGVKGSPTYVSKIFRNSDYRNCNFIETSNKDYTKTIKNKIEEIRKQ